jgi:pimeloyl-ACP methyl ester carboxylesterase
VTALDGVGVHVVSSSAALAAAADEPIVVLIHGAMDRSASFGRTVRLLADVPVVRYDRRGYGHSTGLGIGDLDSHVADLTALIAGRPAVLVGHSIGGVIALVAAQRDASVLSVGAWEAPMPWASWWPTSTASSAALARMRDDHDRDDGAAMGDAAERFMRRMIGDERWGRLPSKTRAARRAEGRALVADLVSLQRDAAPYDSGNITQPVLAGSGSDSVPYHQRAAEELASAVPNGELMVVEGADHGAHLSHPHDFAAFVRRAADRAIPIPGTRDRV